MTDFLNSILNSDIIHQNVNQEITDTLDKISHSSILSKEVREKSIESIFHLLATKLTTALQNTEYNCLTDLILNKSSIIVSQTCKLEWPLIENLKLQNFDPLTIFIYNGLRYKYLLRAKFNKDTLLKAFDNIYLLIMKFVEKTNIPFSDEILMALFEDFFEYYIKIKENFDDLSEVEEKIDNLNLEIQEVTNINGMLSMESLDPSNHKEFIIGILFLLFKFKLDRIATDKANETFSSYKNLFKPKVSEYLKRTAPIIHVEIEILLNISLFFSNNIYNSVTNLVNLQNYLRLIKKFKKNLFVIDHINLFENVIKKLVAIFLVSSGLRINDYIKQFLDINSETVGCLSVGESRNYEKILSLNVFNYLKNMNLLIPIKNQADKIQKTAIDHVKNEEILKVFYSNIFNSSQVSKSFDLFSLKAQSNNQFNEIYSRLNK